MIELKKDAIILYTEKSIKNNFLIIKNVSLNIQSYEFRILQEEKNDKLLQPKLDYEGEAMVLKYDISNKVSLDDYIKSNKLKSNDLKTIIKSINSMLNEIENYLVSENSIILDTKSIYIDKRKGKCNLTFVPVPDYNSDFSFELSKLLIRLMRYVDVNDKEALALAYGLFIKSSKDNFTISDLMELCSDIEEVDENDELLLNKDFESLYDGKIIEENEYNNYYNNVNENLGILNTEYLFADNDKYDNKISNKHINQIVNTKNEDRDSLQNDKNDIEDFDNEDDELLQGIKMEEKTKRMLLDYFDDNDANVDNKTDNVLKEKRISKKRSITSNRQKLVIDSNIIKKIVVIILCFLPIVLCLIIGGMELFYKSIGKILFFEIFILMFMLLNNVLNRLLRAKR